MNADALVLGASRPGAVSSSKDKTVCASRAVSPPIITAALTQHLSLEAALNQGGGSDPTENELSSCKR